METYIISRMYAGSFLNENLGGEYINLLHDDQGRNYIFIGPRGFINPTYKDTIKGVILTRFSTIGCFKVLGVAKISAGNQVSKREKNKLKESYDSGKIKINEYIEENDIKYGGFSLKTINNDQLSGADITFKSDVLLLPKNELFITDSHTKDYVVEDAMTVNLKDKRFPQQSLVAYITDKENPEAFKQLTALIEDESLWDKDKINQVVDGEIIDEHYNFLDIIHKDYDELAYSNLFAYIFKNYPFIFIDFAKQVLGVELALNYEVEREKNNIDLWIEDQNNIIVIENKIKSGISGVSPRHNFAEDGMVQSQLLKYYQKTEANKEKKQTHYFLFIPNYNKINLKEYSGSKHYQEIRYSELYRFFSRVKNEDPYFKEFVKTLYKHTKDREVDYAEDMKFRFLRRLNQIKKRQG